MGRNFPRDDMLRKFIHRMTLMVSQLIVILRWYGLSDHWQTNLRSLGENSQVARNPKRLELFFLFDFRFITISHQNIIEIWKLRNPAYLTKQESRPMSIGISDSSHKLYSSFSKICICSEDSRSRSDTGFAIGAFTLWKDIC